MSGKRLQKKRYVVQTADAIIERCLLMATDPGDLVLDPTCGSGATAEVAEQWGRRWITIDVSRVVIALARQHLMTRAYPWYRTLDGGSDPAAGLDVETMQRVSAATLAYDKVDLPENTIPLVDRPRAERGITRISSPFTVESSSPYYYVPFAGTEDLSADPGTAPAEKASVLLEHLEASPVCDADGRPVLQVVETVPWPEGRLVSHEATCQMPGRSGELTAAVFLAADDVTVTNELAVAAVSEARRNLPGCEHLIIVGFAFEPGIAAHIATCAVYRVMASRDLQIPELSKSADAGAFTLLGEPDVALTVDAAGLLVAEVRGYDTYDPASGTPAAGDGDDVDCWMIDTDHDGMSFLARLTYFPGGIRDGRGLDRMLKSLGTDVVPEARRQLVSVRSQPFPPPQEGHSVAVKIVTRTGAEMTTVLRPK